MNEHLQEFKIHRNSKFKKETHESPSRVVLCLNALPSSAAPPSSMPSPRRDINLMLLFVCSILAIAAKPYLYNAEKNHGPSCV